GQAYGVVAHVATEEHAQARARHRQHAVGVADLDGVGGGHRVPVRGRAAARRHGRTARGRRGDRAYSGRKRHLRHRRDYPQARRVPGWPRRVQHGRRGCVSGRRGDPPQVVQGPPAAGCVWLPVDRRRPDGLFGPGRGIGDAERTRQRRCPLLDGHRALGHRGAVLCCLCAHQQLALRPRRRAGWQGRRARRRLRAQLCRQSAPGRGCLALGRRRGA
ncbi:hypothetical protein H4R21_005621, partial [Coemansia helicoidea]